MLPFLLLFSSLAQAECAEQQYMGATAAEDASVRSSVIGGAVGGTLAGFIGTGIATGITAAKDTTPREEGTANLDPSAQRCYAQGYRKELRERQAHEAPSVRDE